MRPLSTTVAVGLGLLIAAWSTAFFFTMPPDRVHDNDDDITYIQRLIDFREALDTGHYSPQWSTYMHDGLGGPYFGYYQPGFFYLASLFPHRLAPVRAIGMTVFLLLLVGFLGMSHLVGAPFGAASGLLAGTLFVLSTYAGAEIRVRGDYAELTAMMLLPLLIDAFLSWRHSRTVLALGILSVVTGAVIVSHAPVALVTLLVLGVFIFGENVLIERNLRPAIVDGVPIICGGLLAAFYWFPLIFEWHLVQPEKAFLDFYSYRNHFVGLRALAGLVVDPRYLVPVGLGFPLLALIFLTAVSLLKPRERWTDRQKELIRLLVCVALVGTFLMLRLSTPVWNLIPVLQRIQFPWRILTLLTMSLSGLASLWVARTGRYAFIAAAAAMVVVAVFYPYGGPPELLTVVIPERPSGLARMHYAPDVENEWLPRGAPTLPADEHKETATSEAECRAYGFERSQSRLVLNVETTPGCVVRLPHYYFPVGWAAAISGQPIPIENEAGFMALRFPESTRGEVVLRFGLTPARRRGLWISAAALFLLAGAAVWEAAAKRRAVAYL